jgi:hypothetical protein
LNELPLLVSILIKAGSAAAVVVAATMLAERSGPLVAGLIIALPVSVGPTYVMLALTAPPEFVARSALGSIASNGAVAVYGTLYVLLSRRAPIWVSVPASLGGWFCTAWLFDRFVPDPAALVAGASGLLVAGTVLTRKAAHSRRLLAGATRAWDLPVRAAFVGVFAASLVTASHLIGPGWTGLLAAFPIALTSSIVLLQPRVGAGAAAAVIATAVQGIVVYPLAFSLVYLLSRPVGVWWALAAWLTAIVGWGALVFVWRTRIAPPG